MTDPSSYLVRHGETACNADAGSGGLPIPTSTPLERARPLTDDIGPDELSDKLREATKLTIYVGRKERLYGMPAYIALCDPMYRRALAGRVCMTSCTRVR